MIQVVCGIIENREGLVLLAQRPMGDHLAGLWEFPGGKVENGESRENALIRELKEELELDVRIEKYLGSFPYNYPKGAIELHAFRVTAQNEPRATLEVQHFTWTLPEKILGFDLAPADLKPLESYLALRPVH